MSDRIKNADLKKKVCTADEAAAQIENGENIGFAGFTGSGYPKLVPGALAARMKEAHERGEEFRVGSWTGASTAPELDGALAEVNGVAYRMPYQSDPVTRSRINAGEMDYVDFHLSHTNRMAMSGTIGSCDVAVIEAAGITEDGKIIPSASVGANQTYCDLAKKVIIEVNSWQTLDLEGMHDIFVPGMPPSKIIPITRPDERIGTPYYEIDPSKVVAIVETELPDRNSPFKPLDDDSKAIAGHILEFLEHEVKIGRLPKKLPPMQSGVGNIPNAVLAGLAASDLEGLTSYTEVIQDGMIDLLLSGKLECASATAFSLSPEYAEAFNNENAKKLNKKIVLRPQDVSNHPEVIRRLGLIAMNGLLEADIYGHVNSTHVMGTKIMNGIGGSGDFTRNAQISVFMTPSTAKGGAISAIVPFASHIDHTEHDTGVIVTEQGLADVRGLVPRKRAQLIIDKCAHPDYKPLLQDYFDRACAAGNHEPHLLDEAFSFQHRFTETGSMKK